MRFKPDLDDQLAKVSFSALTLFVWSSAGPVKMVPKMAYNVLINTLSLYTTKLCAMRCRIFRYIVWERNSAV